jgi:hypothetical protein
VKSLRESLFRDSLETNLTTNQEGDEGMTTKHYAHIREMLKKVGLAIYDLGKPARPSCDAIFYTRGDGEIRNPRTVRVFMGSEAVEDYCKVHHSTRWQSKPHTEVPQTRMVRRIGAMS